MAPVSIFVPQPIPESALTRLRALGELRLFDHLDRRISRKELRAAAADAHVLYGLGRIAYDREVIAAARNLRLIAVMNSAATFVDVAAATVRGIPVSGIDNLMARTTGEYTFALIAATAWRIPEADVFLRSGRWAQNQSMAFLGRRLFGKTLGILGLGAIGQEVAKRARAFDMQVLYNKRSRLDPDEERERNVAYRTVDELFCESDVLVVTTALTRETRGMVSAELFGRMRPTAIFVNTARGGVVDEEALEAALRSRQIAGAGLDVFARERPDYEDAGPRPGLLELPNVVLTPHIGSAAIETREEMAHQTVDAIEDVLNGRRPRRVLNPEVYGDAPRIEERIG